MVIGLKRGTVELVSYDTCWAKEFEDERRRLLDIFGDKIIAVEHIGSTSIPGLIAKPIIDINVAISSLERAEDFILGLQSLGYEYMKGRQFDDRYFFPKGPASFRTHHLNLVEYSSETGWNDPLLFKKYLIEHPFSMREYASLKQHLALECKNDRKKYTEAKSDFIKSVIIKARNLN